MSTKYLMIMILFIACISCDKKSEDEPTTSQAKLLFSSGFEGDFYLGEVEDGYQQIIGKDGETGFTWPINILGSGMGALHYIDDDNFQGIESEIQTVIGHDGLETKALYNIEHYNSGVTQCPYEILEITEGRKDLYVKFWLKLDSTSLKVPDMWRTFFEWKTIDYAEGTGFRLIAYIYTDGDGIPYWHWQGDANPMNPVWEIDNRNVSIPMEEWFLTEFYWHWSEGDDGRALWKVNGQVIGDHYGPSTRNSKPIDFIMITQIYGNANPKYQWVDDIEIWDGLVE